MVAPLLATGAVENCTNPGTGAFTLLGPTSGVRRRFRDDGRMSNGRQVWYTASDGSQVEWGVGTLTIGSNGASDTLSRDTVTENTAGNTNRLNFTGNLVVYSAANSWAAPLKDLAGNGFVGTNNDLLIKTINDFGLSGLSFGDVGGISTSTKAIGNGTGVAQARNAQLLYSCVVDFDPSYTIQSGDSFILSVSTGITSSGGSTLAAASDEVTISGIATGKIVTNCVTPSLNIGAGFGWFVQAQITGASNGNIKARCRHANASLLLV